MVAYKVEHFDRMDNYQKKSNLLFQCSVEHARVKFNFSEAGIDEHTQVCAVVKIPTNKFVVLF